MRTDNLTGGPSRAVARPLTTEADWWRVRDLLSASWPDVPLGWNWDIRRWDGWRFHRAVPVPVEELAAVIRLWEGPDGELLGVAHPEGPGEAFLELRPGARSIEPEMLAWAEAALAAGEGPDEESGVTLAVYDDDGPRQALAAARGYVSLGRGGWIRSLDLERDLEHEPPGSPGLPPIAAGYRLRTTRVEEADCERMAALLNRSFGRTVHGAAEYRTFMTRSPSFSEDLNLVAEAPDGTFACHVGVTIDQPNRHALVEPVATDPDHRRRGLARVLILEGLRRAAAAGARTADVETGEREAANALYEACGFGSARHMTLWRKVLREPA